MKKISTLILVLVATFLVLMPASGSASTSTTSMEEVHQYLIEQGLTHKHLTQMPDEYKINLYRDGAKLVALDDVYDSFKETVSPNSMPTKEHTISPLALKNWTAGLQVWQITSGKKDIVKHRMFYSWDWNYTTRFNLIDKFGIAWSDDWDALPETAHYSYTVDGKNTAGYTASRTYNYTGYSDYKPGNGIGWAVDILFSFERGASTYYSMGHSGFGSIDIVKSHDRSGRRDSSSAVAQYFHREANFNGNLTFNGSATPGIAITYGLTYDSSPQSGKQWYWNHRDY